MRTLTTEAVLEHARMLMHQGATEAIIVAELLEDSLNDITGPNLTGQEQTILLSSLGELAGWANSTHDALRDKVSDPSTELLAKLHEHFSRMPGDEVSEHWKAEIAKVIQVPATEENVIMGRRLVLTISTTSQFPNETVLIPYMMGQFSVAPTGYKSLVSVGSLSWELYFPSDADQDVLSQEASMLCKLVMSDPDFGCADLFVDDIEEEEDA